MKRKEFLRKGILGTGFFLSSSALGTILQNKNDELEPLSIVGFNHIPNTNSKIMNNTVLHKSDTRGFANHGWLKSRHTFSFANYYNPERMHFGVLRVLNDDVIAPGSGFGTHPHDNMEIVSIPLVGDLEHKDSMGNVSVIKQGEIQVMSAGTGVTHSEYSKSNGAQFLQIWLFPNKRNVKPRYDQFSFTQVAKINEFYQILSPNEHDQGVWIHQDAWFHMGQFSPQVKSVYELRMKNNGLYVFILEGEALVAGNKLASRDGFGIWNVDKVEILSLSNCQMLLMEVPMSL